VQFSFKNDCLDADQRELKRGARTRRCWTEAVRSAALSGPEQ
jgi:hypothetical protein